jgi:oligopeptide transport system substrate-binding protein
VSEARTTYLEYNQTGKNKFLANDKIRQALNLATNRKELVDQVSSGISTVATGFAPVGLAKTASGEDLSKYVAQDYTYDPKKAAKLFAEGLKEVGETKMSVTITATSESASSKSMIDYLQGSWQKSLPGLKVEEKFVPFKQLLQDSQSQNFEIVASGWQGDYPEGSTFYDLFKDGAAYNNGKFVNTAYTKAVNKAETTDALKDSARDADYKQAEAALFENSNVNPLFYVAGYVLARPNVEGIVINSTGLATDLKHAYRQ